MSIIVNEFVVSNQCPQQAFARTILMMMNKHDGYDNE